MGPTNTTHILENLRKLMKSQAHVPKILHALIIPSEDAHQSEYTAACDDRRAFISGLNGSYGSAVVTGTKAALWTDGRYYLQAMQQMDHNWMLMKQNEPATPKQSEWLSSEFKAAGISSGVVGADPLVLDRSRWKELDMELASKGHELVAVIGSNLVDLVWGQDRPQRPSNQVIVLEERWTGRSLSAKLSDLRLKLKEKNCAAVVLTALDDVAYLFNLRGSDIPYNPLFFSYAMVTLEEAHLFMSRLQLSPAVLDHLQGGQVTVNEYQDFLGHLEKAGAGLPSGQPVWLPSRCSEAVARAVPAHLRYTACSPVAMAKAIKNETEIKGMEACHVRDGAAVCSFLAWLEQEAPSGRQTEMSAAAHLEQCRARQKEFRGLSFPSISSVGANAAIVHYEPSEETDTAITDKHVYLIDSGGHYSDGTTDVTRTLHFGTPAPLEREAFTRVLKGHIALATAVFPNKTKGHYLDSFARQFLWAVGLNYSHGTGHGVGMYLNVHEGPMGISWRVYPDDPGMQEGMFVSDEPGYYKDGEFGIRIESIVQVVKAETPFRHNDEDFLTFKATTLVPIQQCLIDPLLLTDQEMTWLTLYHERVLAEVGPVLQEQHDQMGYDWLVRETRPLQRTN